MNQIKVYVFLLFMVVFSTSSTFAQAPCGTDQLWNRKIKENPALLTRQQAFDDGAANFHPSYKTDSVRVIPVVFHIIHQYGAENISKQKVLDQIDNLNKAWRAFNSDTSKINPIFKGLKADCKVEFRLAKKDPYGNCTEGIERIVSSATYSNINNEEAVKDLSRWDNKKYLNIWVVTRIDGGSGNGTILGYSTFPGSTLDYYDGIVMRADQVNSTSHTLTHECGHYFSLYHTFQNGCSGLTSGTCLYYGDRVCDTPPTADQNFGCPKGQNTCSETPNQIDMIENFMDYSDCTSMFTKGQKSRVDYTLTYYRANLWSDANLKATGVDGTYNPTMCIPNAVFTQDYPTVCEGKTLTFYDQSYGGPITNYRWTFEGGTPNVSTLQNPTVTYTKAGTYYVRLKVSNSVGADSVTIFSSVKVLPGTSNKPVPFQENFETYNSTGWSFTKDAMGKQWALTSSVGSSGSHCLKLYNLYAIRNQNYTITLPAIDLTTASSFTMSFKLAYAQKYDTSNDIVRVSFSNNCGNYFSTKYMKAGKLAATTTPRTTDFTPLASDWKEIIIDLTYYKNEKNLIPRIEFQNSGGNNVYIDDINIGGDHASIQDNTGTGTFLITPNPVKDIVFLSAVSTRESSFSLEVYDATGKKINEIKRLTLQNGKTELSFKTEELFGHNKGLYLVRLISGDGVYNHEVIVGE